MKTIGVQMWVLWDKRHNEPVDNPYAGVWGSMFYSKKDCEKSPLIATQQKEIAAGLRRDRYYVAKPITVYMEQ